MIRTARSSSSPIKHSHGVGVFEVICSMAIAAPILALLAMLVSQFARLGLAALRTYERSYRAERAAAALLQPISDLDSHRMRIPPRVHRAGEIRFTDGSPNPVLTAPRGLRPDPDADAVTGLVLRPERILAVGAGTREHDTLRFYACARYYEPAFPSAEVSFIAVSVDGMNHLTGTIARSGRCYTALLKDGRSMSLPPSSAAPELATALVPIEREYSIYRSRGGDLRYLGHRGGSNIENQPLLSGAPRAEISLGGDAGLGLHSLSIELTFPQGRPVRRAAMNRITRTPHFNLILNPP